MTRRHDSSKRFPSSEPGQSTRYSPAQSRAAGSDVSFQARSCLRGNRAREVRVPPASGGTPRDAVRCVWHQKSRSEYPYSFEKVSRKFCMYKFIVQPVALTSTGKGEK